MTSSGSNFRVPQVNFYRAIQGQEPSAISTVVALNFMGVRFDKLAEERRKELEVFFSYVAYKRTAEWKEEIVYFNTDSSPPVKAVFPDGTPASILAGQDPRKIFADWLISPKNPWFSRNIVNRIWSWLLGKGLIHEVDDIRKDNPPVHPKLLSFLEKELVKSKYNLKHIFRIILNSKIYQQSSLPLQNNPDAEKYFACYPVRRLDAEVLIDALCKIFGGKENYQSPIPEPFTFIPEENRSIELSDGSITSQFLEMFGRPPRDTGLESERSNKTTGAQVLHMLNSSHIQIKIEKSRQLRQATKYIKKNVRRRNRKYAKKKNTQGDATPLINLLYLSILSRMPTKKELTVITKYYENIEKKQKNVIIDLAWALVNSVEFQFKH